MDSKAILADLRQQFGADKAFLYAAELAQLLGKTTAAVYALIERGGVPFPVIEVGGRPAVSIFAVAAILAGEITPPERPSKAAPTTSPAVPAPKRKLSPLAKLRRSAELHRDFYDQFAAELIRIELDEETRTPDGERQGPLRP